MQNGVTSHATGEWPGRQRLTLPFVSGSHSFRPPSALMRLRHQLQLPSLALAVGAFASVSPVWSVSLFGEQVGLAPPVAEVSYTILEAPGEQARSRFTSDQLAILEKLNRVDVTHMNRLPSLVVPEIWLDDETGYSPLPLCSAWAAAHTKAIVVNQPSQVFGGYERGKLVRWGPVSTGREAHPTLSGLHHLNWKSRGRTSTIDSDWYMPWYFNFHNDRGLAFHEYALPGRPASHACIRMLERDAKWLFDWGEGWTLDQRGWEVLEPGTPVWIIGHYDFDSPPPWRSLTWLAAGITLPAPPPPSKQSASREPPLQMPSPCSHIFARRSRGPS